MKTKQRIIIGDSHSVFLGNLELDVSKSELPQSTLVQRSSSMIFPKYDLNYIFQYIGPTLAWNFTADNIKKDLEAYRNVDELYFYLGEIDIRCHLSIRENADELVEKYSGECKKLSDEIGAKFRFILPPPPADFGFFDQKYPKNGSLSERSEQHFRFSQGLMRVTKELSLSSAVHHPHLNYLSPLTMPRSYSDDGCHFNRKANATLREVLFTRRRGQVSESN